MDEIKLKNGIKVQTNPDTNISLVTLSDGKINELKQFLATHPDAWVIIEPTIYDQDFGYDQPFNVYDLDCLKELDSIKNLMILIHREMNSFDGLKYLNNLEKLDATFANMIDFDFSYFSKLKQVEFYWSAKTKFFFNCTNLEVVKIWKYKSKDYTLGQFSKLVKLKKLTILQSNIIRINGIEHLESLTDLALCFNPKLEINMNQFESPLDKIETLEINNCKNVRLDFVKVFPNLKKLHLVKFQDIDELRPIFQSCFYLKELNIEETKVLEKDTYYNDYSQIKIYKH